MKVGDVNIESIVSDKAKELVLRYGVKGWNMNDLARESNMSKRTLYKIIGTKEDLLYKLSYDSHNESIIGVKKYLSSDKPFPDLLNDFSNHITESFDDFMFANTKTIRLEYPRIREMEERQIRKHQRILIKFFQKGKDEGYVADHVKPITIHKIINALIEYHIFRCDSKTEFKKEMKEQLLTFFKGVMK